MRAAPFWDLVDFTDSCWLWTGALSDLGYGRYRVGGERRKAHKVAYEERYGPVPSGLELDHLCRVPRCVNPAHLEAVTHQENCRRGEAGKHNPLMAATHCPNGHSWVDNVQMVHGTRTQRRCRTCRSMHRSPRKWAVAPRNVA